MAEQWKVGDVVQLKGGGPRMTVSSVDGDLVECGWFTKDQAVIYRQFNSAMLTRGS